ncbi:MAG: hypothetical protein NUV55_06790 [Sulfuricaulis sp.]|nr:hypothetical protein [Sulfuricaulis sp.]MCR4346891.1 hypothetical protein [Sulfuricaulis sp.]
MAANGWCASKTSTLRAQRRRAADNILRTLEAFGLHWDGEVVYQSRRHALYEEALANLKARNQIYPCA